MIHKKFIAVFSVASAIALVATGCTSGGSDSSSAGSDQLTYGLWDTSQQPAYQACADAFKTKTGITVTIQQTNYTSYFTGLATDFVSGSGPDVFANVTSRYPDYATQGQIVDLTPLIARDKVDLGAFQDASNTNWKMDDKVWGIPKDIDTVGLAYDSDAVAAAGIDPASLNSLAWNSTDGGTFEKTIKQLTLDSNGRNGLDPAFDKSNVTRYGMIAPNVTDISGHIAWGNFVLSSGDELLDPNPFGTTWNFDKPSVISTLSWYQKMIQGGWMQTPSLNSSLSSSSLFDAGKIAMATDGTWDAGVYAKGTAPVKWAQFPAGSTGLKAYTNSLADSINANSKNQEQAWDWVKYLGSQDCQDTVASYGVVFPALKVSTDKAIAAYAKNGSDMQPLLDTINTADAVVPLPVALKYSQVEQSGDAALQDILLNGADPSSTLRSLNEQVNALYK